MHVAVFVDQHPHSLGGVQTAVLLQRKFLERMGVRVTIFAPKTKRAKPDPVIRVLPSNYGTLDGEYSVVWSLWRAARFCEPIFSTEKFDLVHIQGDFSSASLGTTLARRFNLPIVYTSHTNLEVGGEKVFGHTGKMLLLRFFTWQFAHFLKTDGRPKVKNAWEYMRFVQRDAHIAMAPSSHHAKTLRDYGIAEEVRVMINGVDDDTLDQVVRKPRDTNAPVKIAWAGRLLPEKRALETIEAFARSKVKAKLTIIGSGRLKKPARVLALRLGVYGRVKFAGRLPHQKMLQALADADVLMQSSEGFETQGLTVFEAAAVGTPSILCDRLVAAELPAGSYWLSDSPEIVDMSAAIALAVENITAGDNRGAQLPNKMKLRQSELTAETVALYRRAIADHGSQAAEAAESE